MKNEQKNILMYLEELRIDTNGMIIVQLMREMKPDEINLPTKKIEKLFGGIPGAKTFGTDNTWNPYILVPEKDVYTVIKLLQKEKIPVASNDERLAQKLQEKARLKNN